MRDSYAANGCIFIQIPAPPLLVQQVEARSKSLGVTKQEVYRRMLTDFLHRYSDRSPTCHATYKKSDAPKIRIWVEPAVAEPLKALAARSHVTLRAMAYTALIMKIGHVRHGGAMRHSEP